jgi:UDP-N-acetylglucosamine/UDP-N-acetyl-alpha-D-glucosaminouronate 4-epimerase
MANRTMKSVLVTGGAGFIGSHLVRRLFANGYRVRVLDAFATGRAANLDGLDGVDIQEGDVRSPADVAKAMRGIEGVFHLAALPSVARSWKDPVTTLATNAHGTANVVEAAIAAGVSALVYSSSSSVYGDQEATKKSEDLQPRPISPYGYSKLLGEKIALAHANSDTGIRVVSLRYFNVFGARQDPDSPYSAVVPLFIKHALAGTTATIDGDGHQSRDFTHVDNVVDANICALESGASGLALNVACGQSHSLLELVDGISKLNTKPLRTVFGPPREGDIKHSLADISLAKEKIGYEPKVTFMDGLRRVFADYRSA